MGYQTDFRGQFRVEPPLTPEQVRILDGFADERHEPAYYNRDGDYPSYCCQWVPTPDGTALEWDGGDKFYEYEEWMRYLIHRFLNPWGCHVRGAVEFDGESWEDRGVMYVDGNNVDLVYVTDPDGVTATRAPEWYSCPDGIDDDLRILGREWLMKQGVPADEEDLSPRALDGLIQSGLVPAADHANQTAS